MKKITILFALSMMIFQLSYAQTGIVGTWKTIDDGSGDEKSYIEITEKNGKYFGTITKLLQSPEDSVCKECSGDKKDQPIVGMVILENLKTYKDYYSYGQILDPESGKEYKCSLWQDSADQLTVRGYVGISALGRSQNWYRVKN